MNRVDLAIKRQMMDREERGKVRVLRERRWANLGSQGSNIENRLGERMTRVKESSSIFFLILISRFACVA